MAYAGHASDRGTRNLCERYEGYFDIGAAVNLTTIETQKQLPAAQFNSVTAENDMKFERMAANFRAAADGEIDDPANHACPDERAYPHYGRQVQGQGVLLGCRERGGGGRKRRIFAPFSLAGTDRGGLPRLGPAGTIAELDISVFRHEDRRKKRRNDDCQGTR